MTTGPMGAEGAGGLGGVPCHCTPGVSECAEPGRVHAPGCLGVQPSPGAGATRPSPPDRGRPASRCPSGLGQPRLPRPEAPMPARAPRLSMPRPHMRPGWGSSPPCPALRMPHGHFQPLRSHSGPLGPGCLGSQSLPRVRCPRRGTCLRPPPRPGTTSWTSPDRSRPRPEGSSNRPSVCSRGTIRRGAWRGRAAPGAGGGQQDVHPRGSVCEP